QVCHHELEEAPAGDVVVELETAGRGPVPQQSSGEQRGAHQHADLQDVADQRLHVERGRRARRAGGGARFRHRDPRTPRTSISTPRASRTTRKKRRIDWFGRRTSSRVPTYAPSRMPRITGAARPGSIKPPARYTLVPASAVTPMIRLLVVVATFAGRPIATSK